MNDYEAKIEAKRERYAERAEKLRAQAKDLDKARRETADLIPMGQPILVGHHSERRHRRDLERMDRQMRKAIEAERKADHYERKAERYGTHGISSDDPEAVAKLETKIAELEREREEIKAFNRKARKEGTEKAPSYMLSNLGNNLRRYKKRLESLKAKAAMPEVPAIEGNGFRIEQCKDDNRVRFFFDAKPDREVRALMKREGFRWSPKAGAWQRQLTPYAVDTAKRLAQKIFGFEG
jgi:hypothetical protein